jgi:hypothetical protein
MRRLIGPTVLALLVATPSLTAFTSTLVTAAASGSQWEKIDAPDATGASQYQVVETAPDGSGYAAGWQRFPSAGLGDVYESIVRKFDPAGTVVWTAQIGGLWSTPPTTPDLVVDGLGNPYIKLCRSSCVLTVFDPASGAQVESIGDDGLQ